jgi:hypothetical protein
VKRHASGIGVPNLDDRNMIRLGHLNDSLRRPANMAAMKTRLLLRSGLGRWRRRFPSPKNLIGNGNVRKAEALAIKSVIANAARACRDDFVDWKNAQGQAESHLSGSRFPNSFLIYSARFWNTITKKPRAGVAGLPTQKLPKN